MTKAVALDRAKTVMAMDYIARCINNEEIFMTWLESGVADGDIDEHTTPEDIINDEYYIANDNFSYLMCLFLRLMCEAKKDGGLYSGSVTSKPY